MSSISKKSFANKSKSCAELSFSVQFKKQYLEQKTFSEILEEKNKALCEIDELEDEVTNEDSDSGSNVVIVSNRSNSSYYDPEIRKILNCYL